MYSQSRLILFSTTSMSVKRLHIYDTYVPDVFPGAWAPLSLPPLLRPWPCRSCPKIWKTKNENRTVETLVSAQTVSGTSSYGRYSNGFNYSTGVSRTTRIAGEKPMFRFNVTYTVLVRTAERSLKRFGRYATKTIVKFSSDLSSTNNTRPKRTRSDPTSFRPHTSTPTKLDSDDSYRTGSPRGDMSVCVWGEGAHTRKYDENAKKKQNSTYVRSAVQKTRLSTTRN